MVEYLAREDLDRLTYEICETCEQKSKPETHLCAAMRLDDPRVARVFRHGTYHGARVLAAIRTGVRSGRPANVRHLPDPETIGALCEWSKWDLRRLYGVAHHTTSVVLLVLTRAGLSLRDVSQQKAYADRERAMREARKAVGAR